MAGFGVTTEALRQVMPNVAGIPGATISKSTSVKVVVTIDKTGNVIEAHALNERDDVNLFKVAIAAAQ